MPWCYLYPILRKSYQINHTLYRMIKQELSLLLVHCLYGSPSKPGGHEQVALWFSVEQIAVWLHGLSAMQGLMQLLLRHAWLKEHSESEEQPIGWGSTKENKYQYFRYYHYL